MSSIRDTIDQLANSRGRGAPHIAIGAVLIGGAVLTSALIAARFSPAPSNPEVKREYDKLVHPSFQPPPLAFALVWPPLFASLVVSGLRIWNAPDGPRRTRALGLWSSIQGLNALWMALGPKRLPLQAATAAVSLGASAAYAREAALIDKPAAATVGPFLAWIGFANLLTDETWRLNRRAA